MKEVKFVFPKFLYARTTNNKTIDVSYAPQSLDAVEYIRSDSLSEEPNKDLEKEISTWIPAHISGGDDEVWKDAKNAIIEWAGIVARHFYEFGKGIK